MREKNEACLNMKMARLSVEQLDELLQMELQKEKPDEEVVLPILQELEEREEGCPAKVTQGASAIWDKVKNRALPQIRHRRRYIWRLGTIAAVVLCVVLLFLPQTVGAESVFDVLIRWTEEVLSFFDPQSDQKMPQPDVFSADNPDLQQVYSKVTELGVTKPIVPMWLPEGFDMIELKEVILPTGNKLYAKFMDGDRSIVLSYRISTMTMPSQYEKKDQTMEILEFGGVKHYIMFNEKTFSVVWTVENIEGSVSANIEREDVLSIIKSIYRRKLS